MAYCPHTQTQLLFAHTAHAHHPLFQCHYSLSECSFFIIVIFIIHISILISSPDYTSMCTSTFQHYTKYLQSLGRQLLISIDSPRTPLTSNTTARAEYSAVTYKGRKPSLSPDKLKSSILPNSQGIPALEQLLCSLNSCAPSSGYRAKFPFPWQSTSRAALGKGRPWKKTNQTNS